MNFDAFINFLVRENAQYYTTPKLNIHVQAIANRIFEVADMGFFLGDMKPSNILVNKQKDIRFIDFDPTFCSDTIRDKTEKKIHNVKSFHAIFMWMLFHQHIAAKAVELNEEKKLSQYGAQNLNDLLPLIRNVYKNCKIRFDLLQDVVSKFTSTKSRPKFFQVLVWAMHPDNQHSLLGRSSIGLLNFAIDELLDKKYGVQTGDPKNRAIFNGRKFKEEKPEIPDLIKTAEITIPNVTPDDLVIVRSEQIAPEFQLPKKIVFKTPTYAAVDAGY